MPRALGGGQNRNWVSRCTARLGFSLIPLCLSFLLGLGGGGNVCLCEMEDKYQTFVCVCVVVLLPLLGQGAFTPSRQPPGPLPTAESPFPSLPSWALVSAQDGGASAAPRHAREGQALYFREVSRTNTLRPGSRVPVPLPLVGGQGLSGEVCRGHHVPALVCSLPCVRSAARDASRPGCRFVSSRANSPAPRRFPHPDSCLINSVYAFVTSLLTFSLSTELALCPLLCTKNTVKED